MPDWNLHPRAEMLNSVQALGHRGNSEALPGWHSSVDLENAHRSIHSGIFSLVSAETDLLELILTVLSTWMSATKNQKVGIAAGSLDYSK